MNDKIAYSVIMLVEDDGGDFRDYLISIHQEMKALGFSHEIILALNGPNAPALKYLDAWPDDGPEVMVIELRRKVYSGTCLQAFLGECQGETLVVCGPYRQVSKETLKQLLDTVASGEADLGLPWRRNRVDPRTNQWQSRFFNYVVYRMTGVKFHDLSTRLRVIRRSVFEETSFHGDLYRFLPVLAKRRGFKVVEVPADHVEERGKEGYFGLSVYISRIIDLLTIHFNLYFARKPLRYFGLRGGGLLVFGVLFLIGSLVSKAAGVDSLGNSPFLMIGLVLVLTGCSIWGVGLLGEILVFALGRKRKDYIVEKVI